MGDWILIFQSAIITLGLLATVYFSYLTARNSKRSMTAQALNDFGLDIGQRAMRLREIFDGPYGTRPIALEKIKVLMRDSADAREIKDYLNAYERLCRNVNTGIYDAKVVKIARGRDICNAYQRFSKLINERRNNGSNSWRQLEYLAIKWDSTSGRGSGD